MEPPSFDSGIPVLPDPVGRIKITPSSGRTHHVTLESLVPGNAFHFTIMVVDPGGNWDVLTKQFRDARAEGDGAILPDAHSQ